MLSGKMRTIAVILATTVAAAASAQAGPTTQPAELASGFSMRPNGVIDLSAGFFEVNYYDAGWTIAQQHDRFTPTHDSSADTTGGRVVTGTLTTAGGPATLTERVEVSPDGGLRYHGDFASDKPLASNELSVTFILPLDPYGGKELIVDGKPVPLPTTPAAKGSPILFTADGARSLTIPAPAGPLVVTGDFKLLLNDDREWNDARYSLRLYFTPGSGALTQSKIDLDLKYQPAPK